MQPSWLLKCGSDTVGTVLLETFENWHTYGRLEPGPDYERYREPLEQARTADQVYTALFYSDNPVLDEKLKAQDRRDKAEEALEPFAFYFEEKDTHMVHPIHEFRPTGDNDGIYWRWGKEPTER